MLLPRLAADRPGLLVSVRDAREAAVAIDAGVDWLDVKEPSRGPLGAAEPAVVQAIVHRCAGRIPLSMAAGELRDYQSADQPPWTAPPGICAVKFGLSGCDQDAGWAERWQRAAADHCAGAAPVAVVYADWQRAAAPTPEEVLQAAERFDCPALLVDTYDKTAGTLVDLWPPDELSRFAAKVQRRRMAIVLAGSLSHDALRIAAAVRPDLLAVRGAVCDDGRHGSISPRRLHDVQQIVKQARRGR